jgi:hypothetical protein
LEIKGRGGGKKWNIHPTAYFLCLKMNELVASRDLRLFCSKSEHR